MIDYAMASGSQDLAQRLIERFHGAERKTESAQPFLRYATALLDRDRNEEALRILSMIPVVGSSEDKVSAALLRKRARDYTEAHRLFLQAYPDRMDDPKVVQEFAQTKLALARPLESPRDRATKRRLNQEAVELLRRALQLATDPMRQAWCWHDLATTLAWLREPATEVEAAFLKAIALRPDERRFQEDYQKWKAKDLTRKRPGR